MAKVNLDELVIVAAVWLENNRFITDMLQDVKSDYSTMREFSGEESEE